MLFSGVGLPKIEYDFHPSYPITDVKIPYAIDEPYDADHGLRKYDAEADEAMRESMKQFGFIDPIVITEDGSIIHGVHRLLVAMDLQQAKVPVLIIKNWYKTRDETQFYNIIANKLNDWSTWLAPNVDKILRSVDGGVKNTVIRGDDGTFIVVPDEAGEYRDLAKKLGLFVDVIPHQLCASTVDLLLLAKMRIKTLGRRYQYNDEQILYIETLRDQIDTYRRKAVDAGLDKTSNLKQKLDQMNIWDTNNMNDGIAVARIVFLHSIGLPNEQIAAEVGVPVDNKADREKAREANISAFMEQVTVENAIMRSSKRPFDPLQSYGYWIKETLVSRHDVMKDPEVEEAFHQLESFRVSADQVANEDGLMPPSTRLDLSSPEANDLFHKTVDLITKKISRNDQDDLPQAVIEDWVKWPEKLKFYANECFRNVIAVDKKVHPKIAKVKTPMDVKTTRQTTDKACSKLEWNEIRYLDAVCDGSIEEPAIDLNYDLIADRKDLSDDEALALVAADANARRDQEIAQLRKTIDRESSKIYDSMVARDFNQILIDIRGKYKKGPLNLFSTGPNRDGDMSADPALDKR
jgi:hypothetical protein